MNKSRAYLALSLVALALVAVGFLLYQTLRANKILPAQIAPGYYKVIEVYDGDTIAVDMNGALEKVRMIGVDTPETHKPDTPVQCYGPEASQFTTNLLSGHSVKLEADPINSNRDRYDRLLRYIYTEEGELVEKLLIGQGYGFAYLSFPFTKSEEFAALQNDAQVKHLGLWAACKTSLQAGRWQTAY